MSVYMSTCVVCGKEYRNSYVWSRQWCSVACQFGSDDEEEKELASLRAKVAADAATIAMMGKALTESPLVSVSRSVDGEYACRAIPSTKADALISEPAVTRAIALDAARREVVKHFAACEESKNVKDAMSNIEQASQALARLAELEGDDGE